MGQGWASGHLMPLRLSRRPVEIEPPAADLNTVWDHYVSPLQHPLSSMAGTTFLIRAPLSQMQICGTGAEAIIFFIPSNFEPGRPLDILPAAFLILADSLSLVWNQ
jgi:hypothetical protein